MIMRNIFFLPEFWWFWTLVFNLYVCLITYRPIIAGALPFGVQIRPHCDCFYGSFASDNIILRWDLNKNIVLVNIWCASVKVSSEQTPQVSFWMALLNVYSSIKSNNNHNKNENNNFFFLRLCSSVPTSYSHLALSLDDVGYVCVYVLMNPNK
jgi:hypothetical protein